MPPFTNELKFWPMDYIDYATIETPPLSLLKKKKLKKKTEKNMKPNQDIWDVTKRKSSKDQHTQTLIFTLFN